MERKLQLEQERLKQIEIEKKLIAEKKAMADAEIQEKNLELQKAKSEIANTATLLEQQQMAWMLRKQRVTLTVQKGSDKLDFDNQAQSWGITMQIQKTMKLKFGLFNRNFFLA